MDAMRSKSMTLVFSLDAVRRLARPGDALADAQQWSERVGVAGSGSDSDSEPVTDVVDAIGIDPDFVSGAGGLPGSLAAARQRSPTDRHVFVGTTETDKTVSALGWEYLSVEAAAEKAGWELEEVDPT